MIQEPQSWLARYGGLVISIGAIVAGTGVILKAAWPWIAAGVRRLVKASAPQMVRRINDTATATQRIEAALPVMMKGIDDCTAAVRVVAVKVEALDQKDREISRKYAVIEERVANLRRDRPETDR